MSPAIRKRARIRCFPGQQTTVTLGHNQLIAFPSEIRCLTNLQRLNLAESQLSDLPSEVWEFTNLERLELQNNLLNHLPAAIGQLTKLKRLELQNNQLNQLPPEIGQLTNLERLELDNNPNLLTPPPEIITQGTMDILTFLRELQESSITRYEAKLMLVGEGGTGKSSLLRALRDKEFDPHSSTTHGIEVGQLELSSPDAKIILNTWDFGGQQIYHTTHQFFLTRRSLYLVIWNARLGVEQGRLHYWLETIKALAPDAPVLLVATHVDERKPDQNYQLYKDTYPQLVGHLSVSNKAGAGIAELKTVLCKIR